MLVLYLKFDPFQGFLYQVVLVYKVLLNIQLLG